MKLTLIFIFFLIACDNSTEEKNNINSKSDFRIQYADSVIDVSSEWSEVPLKWSRIWALGPFEIFPRFGDIDSTWASKTKDDQREFIILYYDTAQTVSKINIYETFNPGSIDTVLIRNSLTKMWNVVYADTAIIVGDTSRLMIINFTETTYKVDAVHIKLNSPKVPGWNEIDAVSFVGKKE